MALDKSSRTTAAGRTKPADGTAVGVPAARRAPRAVGWSASLLPAVNVLLGCVLAGEMAALAWMWVQPVALPASSGPVSPSPAGAADGSSAAADAAPPALSSLVSRTLFQSDRVPSSGGPAGSPVSGQLTAEAVAGRLNLVGLIPGDPPQAILEDAQTKRTYVVGQGQRVLGGLVVESIRDNRVTLDQDGQKIELSL